MAKILKLFKKYIQYLELKKSSLLFGLKLNSTEIQVNNYR